VQNDRSPGFIAQANPAATASCPSNDLTGKSTASRDGEYDCTLAISLTMLPVLFVLVGARVGSLTLAFVPGFRMMLAVNVAGSFLCARTAGRPMSTRYGGRGGTIVNVSSIAAKLGSAGEWIHYAASKGAIDTLTVGLAREVAGEGIRVNAVSPGLIATDLHAAAGAPDRVERLAPGIPMGRAGTTEEVAAAVLWLMSASASYVTGAVVPVGGGR